MCACACVYVLYVCVALLNQHCNTRFTAPACQDSLWSQDFHHLPVHPVEKEGRTEISTSGAKGGKPKKGKGVGGLKDGGGLTDCYDKKPTKVRKENLFMK